jgi:sarcosine oxidase
LHSKSKIIIDSDLLSLRRSHNGIGMSVSHRTDVAVVGLGAMGAAVLCQLAMRGVDVVGIDQYAPPHDQGSSHGETRITRCAVGEGKAYVPLALASHRVWRDLESRTGERLLETNGCLIMGSTVNSVHHGKTDFLHRSVESAKAFSIPHEILTGDDVMRRFPQVEGAEGAQAYFEPGGGFVYPERCIAAQLAMARQNGATFVQAPVIEISQSTDFVRIHADRQIIEASRAVVAAGAWMGRLLGEPFSRLLTVNRQVLHWFPVIDQMYSPDRFPTIIWMHGDTADAYFYGFPSVPGTGLLKAATEQYRVATAPDSVDRTVTPAEADAFYRNHLAGRLRDVGAHAAKSVVCLYTVTPDSGFIIDQHPRMERVTVISACSGHGFKHSAGIGEAVACKLVDPEGGATLAPFSLGRFNDALT